MLKPLARRGVIGALLAGATLATPQAARQATAAGAADGGLSRLRQLPEPRSLPEGLSFTDGEGREVRFETFRGRVLVVNFWATWCPPCVAEMPALDRLHALLTREGVDVLALSSDRGGKAVVQAFYERTGLAHLGIWLDPRGAAGRAVGVRGLPTTLLLNRSGQEVARLEGEAEWDHPQMVAAIRRLARGGRPTTTGT